MSGDNIYSYFFWGFVASSFATTFVYLNESRIENKAPVYADVHSAKRVIRATYETLITGIMGGLLAIVANHNIAIAILVGFLAQSVFIALFKWTKETGFRIIITEMFGSLIRSTTKGVIAANNNEHDKDKENR